MTCEERRLRPGMSAAALRWIALGLMLIDHVWLALLKPSYFWMTCLGRLAFPIFAFQIAQGCVHTSNFKRYALRLFLLGVISELPYNLFRGCAFILPQNQNVIFTLALGLLVFRLCLWAREKTIWHRLLAIGAFAAAYVAADLLHFSYGGIGIATVVMFGLTGGMKYEKFWQTICLLLLNVCMSGYFVKLGSCSVPSQVFAVFSLPIIWLYNGRRGPKNKFLQYSAYLFYPVHIGILAVARWMLVKFG